MQPLLGGASSRASEQPMVRLGASARRAAWRASHSTTSHHSLHSRSTNSLRNMQSSSHSDNGSGHGSGSGNAMAAGWLAAAAAGAASGSVGIAHPAHPPGDTDSDEMESGMSHTRWRSSASSRSATSQRRRLSSRNSHSGNNNPNSASQSQSSTPIVQSTTSVPAYSTAAAAASSTPSSSQEVDTPEAREDRRRVPYRMRVLLFRRVDEARARLRQKHQSSMIGVGKMRDRGGGTTCVSLTGIGQPGAGGGGGEDDDVATILTRAPNLSRIFVDDSDTRRQRRTGGRASEGTPLAPASSSSAQPRRYGSTEPSSAPPGSTAEPSSYQLAAPFASASPSPPTHSAAGVLSSPDAPIPSFSGRHFGEVELLDDDLMDATDADTTAAGSASSGGSRSLEGRRRRRRGGGGVPYRVIFEELTNPVGKYRRVWLLIIFAWMLYNSWMLPFALAFQQLWQRAEIVAVIAATFYIGDVFFCADILLYFFTPYTRDGMYERNLKDIRRNYLRTWSVSQC